MQCHTLYVGWYVTLRLDVSTNLDDITSRNAIIFISHNDLPTFWHDTASSRNESSEGSLRHFATELPGCQHMAHVPCHLEAGRRL